ncbi:MAG: DUF5666 domain-containing protein [Methylotenera sp.]
MNTLMRAYLAILFTSLSLTAIANPCDDGGIGGTGIALSRGIGGTGIIAESSGGLGGTGISGNDIASTDAGIGGTGISNVQKGIGGTGMQAQAGIGGTGIVGVITGFGSICVNGLEIHYYNDTPVDLNGKQISSQSLAIGQVVAVRATGNEQSLVADEIHAYHQITGPVTAVDIAGNSMKVMGQTVAASATQLKGIQIGQWVEVSGLRNADGGVVASRIDQTSQQKNVRMVGNLTRRGNAVYLGGTKIEGLPKAVGNMDTDTHLTGAWNGKAIYVKDMTIGPVSDLLQKVETFHLQGLASDVTNGRLKLAGQPVTVTGATKIIGNDAKHLQGKAVVIRGQVKEGKPTAQSIELRHFKTERKNQHESRLESVHSKHSHDVEEKAVAKEHHSHESTKIESPDKLIEVEKSKKIDKADKAERVEKHERIEKVEKNERIEKVETVEKIERVELPERIDKVELPERFEKVERPEEIERHD